MIEKKIDLIDLIKGGFRGKGRVQSPCRNIELGEGNLFIVTSLPPPLPTTSPEEMIEPASALYKPIVLS